MKHLLILAVFVFFAGQHSSAQCINVKGLRGLFFKNAAAQDAYMATRGYKIYKKFRGRGTIYKNKDDENADVSLNEEGKVITVSYDPPTQPCFIAIKSEVTSIGLKKDKVIAVENFVYTFYSNRDFGVELYRFAGEMEDTYHVTLLSKKEYLQKIEELTNKYE